jgi:tetratricopeptide (TPR) repeat protein
MKQWLVQQKVELFTMALAALAIYSYAQHTYKQPAADLYATGDFYAPPIPLLKHFTFGYKDMIADLYWLRLIQNIEYCGQPKPSNSLTPDGKRMGKNRTPECSKGWSYQMHDFITDLAPDNYIPHLYGPMNLSVIVDDIDGATELFKKSLQRFPDDWMIAFAAGYHYMTELEDFPKAAEYFHQASQHGAPNWVLLLSAKLSSKAGRTEVAISVLKNFIENKNIDEESKKRAQKKLDDLLNSKKNLTN